MGTRFHIAAAKLRSDLTAYAKRFDLLEVAMPAATDKKLGPTLPTLRRWRKAVPPHFEFTVVAGPNLAHLKASDALETELSQAIAAIEALQARCLLLPTPADVTPGALWRERMKKLIARLPHDVTQIIWEPRGVWEVGDAAVAAKKWGITLAVDASRDPVPVGSVAYVRLPSLGETRSYGATALERVVNAIGARRDAYVVLETSTALKECKRLRQLAQGTKASRAGGGRVIRPKTTVRVRDDEQE